MPNAGNAEPQLGPNGRQLSAYLDAPIVAEPAAPGLETLGYTIPGASELAAREPSAERITEENPDV